MLGFPLLNCGNKLGFGRPLSVTGDTEFGGTSRKRLHRVKYSN